MTTNLDSKADLNEVLAEIVSAAEPPGPNALRSLTAQYPEYAPAIIDFVTDWIATESLRSEHDVSAEEVDLVVNRTMSRVQMMLDEAERPASLTDLAVDIQKAGHDFDSFQRAVGIDRSLLDSLISRLIRPATMPKELVERVASTLRRQAEIVRAYMRLEPQLSTAYKARSQPLAKQIDFSYLVQHAALSDEEKKIWLAAPTDPELHG